MTWLQSPRKKYTAVAVGSVALGFLLAWPVFATGQDKKDPAPAPAAKQAPSADANKDLVEQIKQLNARVAQAEGTLKQGLKATPSGAADKGGQADKTDKVEGVPTGKQISAKFQNCIQCHKTRPSGPLPPSHLEIAEGGVNGAKQDDKTGTGDNKTPAADPAAKPAAPADKTADANKELADQIRQLNTNVARLEAALKQDPMATSSGDKKKKGMGMDMGTKEKGMGMGMKEKGMGMGMGMKEKGKDMGMGMMEEKKAAGMGMMAEKKGMPGMGDGKTGTGASTTGTMDQQKIKMLELKMQMLELKMQMLEKGAGTGTDQTAPETAPAPAPAAPKTP